MQTANLKIPELRFLIVEDHQLESALLEQALTGLGAAAVHTAADGKQALRVLRDPASAVDIVISDLMMPGVDGIELIPELPGAAADVALILTSSDALSLRSAVLIARGCGVWLLGAIAKPVSVAKMLPLLELYGTARSSSGHRPVPLQRVRRGPGS